MIILAEQAAPGWVPFVAFAIPALIVGAVLVPALRRRGAASRARRAQRERRGPEAVELGSAAAIEDPSGYSIEAVLKAMAVQPEDHGPAADGSPHDEGWAGTMLGLKSRMSTASSVLEPHVYWGARERGQVFIRVGPDEKIAGGTTMFSNRHVRSITVLRAESPTFDIESQGGALRVSGDAPPELRDLVSRLRADPATWSDLRLAGGPKGIVAGRSAIDGTNGSWAYDLWLCERIARTLDLAPLAPARIGPSWKVPYGMGRSRNPDRR